MFLLADYLNNLCNAPDVNHLDEAYEFTFKVGSYEFASVQVGSVLITNGLEVLLVMPEASALPDSGVRLLLLGFPERTRRQRQLSEPKCRTSPPS